MFFSISLLLCAQTLLVSGWSRFWSRAGSLNTCYFTPLCREVILSIKFFTSTVGNKYVFVDDEKELTSGSLYSGPHKSMLLNRRRLQEASLSFYHTECGGVGRETSSWLVKDNQIYPIKMKKKKMRAQLPFSFKLDFVVVWTEFSISYGY